MEAEYANVTFLWVLPEEIAASASVPLTLADGREVRVELSDADDDAVFLNSDRLHNAPDDCRICLRIFNVYRPRSAPAEEDAP
jgi:hypothetical protein